MAVRGLRSGRYRVAELGLPRPMIVRGVPDRTQPKRLPVRGVRACVRAHPCSNAPRPGLDEGREELDRPAVFPAAADGPTLGQRSFSAPEYRRKNSPRLMRTPEKDASAALLYVL